MVRFGRSFSWNVSAKREGSRIRSRIRSRKSSFGIPNAGVVWRTTLSTFQVALFSHFLQSLTFYRYRRHAVRRSVTLNRELEIKLVLVIIYSNRRLYFRYFRVRRSRFLFLAALNYYSTNIGNGTFEGYSQVASRSSKYRDGSRFS